MARTLAKAKGRHGGEGDPFALIPLEVMQSAALASSPHAAFRVLAILVAGKSKERNGTMACSDSYASRFGMSSRETVYRSLYELKQRGLIVVTRPGLRMRKIPTLYAVTWWPIFNRNGVPLDREEPPTFAFREWQQITPIVGVQTNSHTDSRGDVTPIVGVDGNSLHTDLRGHSHDLHTDGREYSKNLGMGSGSPTAKVLNLMTQLPHLGDADISKITHQSIEFVQRVRVQQERGPLQ